MHMEHTSESTRQDTTRTLSNAPGTTDCTKFCRGRPIKYLSWPDLATCPKSISSGHKGYDTLKMVWRWGRDRKKKICRGYVVGVSQVSRATVVGPW